MALPQLCPLVPATLCGNRSRPVSSARLEDVIRMERLATEAAEALAGASAEDVVRWATDTFGDRICITSSMTDAVIIHLVSRVRPGIDVVFLAAVRAVERNGALRRGGVSGGRGTRCAHVRSSSRARAAQAANGSPGILSASKRRSTRST